MRWWKKIHEGDEVVITGGMVEEVYFPLETDPDFIVRGYVNGRKADIGLMTSSTDGCVSETYPAVYREVLYETKKA